MFHSPTLSKNRFLAVPVHKRTSSRNTPETKRSALPHSPFPKMYAPSPHPLTQTPAYKPTYFHPQRRRQT
ncbi:hypothetical protein P154DRAFT_525685 [Amniculicola lignicola CBS 123094]|uniref:Uncharacterized protein n=1 Tax=Amniculicola lignicola CBS 123094 TaxID=1392246 RepID=A0A6A5W827_9PLEO|nr:hypothetical protein P154DRAFT_525685 [Amniculicola lignicola CBS 123094]